MRTALSLSSLTSLPKTASLTTLNPPSVCNEPSVVDVASVASSVLSIPENTPVVAVNAAVEKVPPATVKVLEECNEKMLPEDIQTKIYTAGKENGYKDNLRDWFKLIYEVVFGDENGPRLGFFISFFGIQETKELIKEKINNV